MTRRIASKELRDTLRDGRFRVLATVVLAISLASLAAGWKHYRDVERQHEEARRATRAQWLSQPKKNPHSAAHYGVYAFKPRSRLSMVDTGIDPYVGVAAWLEAHKQNEFRYRPAQDRTALQRFGDLTAAEGFLVLLPLFIVLVTFNAFSGEREQGTLRQLLSVGVTPRALLAGKALGIAAALGVVLLPATAAGVVGLSLTTEPGALAQDVARASTLLLVYLAYFATIVAVGLGVSIRARSSRTALVVLLAFWFTNSLVIARAASDLAAAWHPTPSAVAFQAALERDLSDSHDMEQRLQRRREELMRRYNVTTMEAVPINFSGVSLQEGEEHGNEVFDEHFGRLFQTYAQQNRVQAWAGLAAPFLPMRTLSMGLAGTDFAHHRAFVDAAESHRRMMQRVLNGDLAEHSRPGQVYLAGEDLWQRIPDFRYDAPGLRWALQQHLVSLGLLGAWLLAAFTFVLTGTRRPLID
ncbi:MAG TPA: ABC transporter permease subunit [Luteitalea sp.]|nr:ABC transporter permease subunit [Luteitalea sp.]